MVFISFVPCCEVKRSVLEMSSGCFLWCGGCGEVEVMGEWGLV